MIPINLNPVFVIKQRHDVYLVDSIGLDATLPGAELPAGTYAIQGSAADLLYISLAGHRFGTPPTAASVGLARPARAYLQWLQIAPEKLPHLKIVPMFNLANRVIASWGEYIQPWLGMLMVDAQNKPIYYHPHYTHRIYFDQPGKIWAMF